jgi:hypothetical protein
MWGENDQVLWHKIDGFWITGLFIVLVSQLNLVIWCVLYWLVCMDVPGTSFRYLSKRLTLGLSKQKIVCFCWICSVLVNPVKSEIRNQLILQVHYVNKSKTSMLLKFQLKFAGWIPVDANTYIYFPWHKTNHIIRLQTNKYILLSLNLVKPVLIVCMTVYWEPTSFKPSALKRFKQECFPCITWKGKHIIIASIWYQVFEE